MAGSSTPDKINPNYNSIIVKNSKQILITKIFNNKK